MSATDAVTASIVLGAAAYLFYRSAWKNRGRCAGCSGGACEKSDLVPLSRPAPRKGGTDPTAARAARAAGR